MTSPSEREKRRLNNRHERILLDLVKQPGNQTCADCKATGPRWASHNLGIFLCISCAGIHRSLGTHVSRVKSLNLDTWTPEQIKNMVNRGNLKMNQFYNPHPEKHPMPLDNKWMEQYIREKYEHRSFMNPNDRATGNPDQTPVDTTSPLNPQGSNITPLPTPHRSDLLASLLRPNSESDSNADTADDDFGEFNDHHDFQPANWSSFWEAPSQPDTTQAARRSMRLFDDSNSLNTPKALQVAPIRPSKNCYETTIFKEGTSSGEFKQQESPGVPDRRGPPYTSGLHGTLTTGLKSSPTQYVTTSTAAPYFQEFDLLR
ncbi:ArfGap-domain-containing protein [Basidiobolus meristosporus CBS 931.73]|uniref:ArfGap-domain-containing protein n=1 Tax=Basidiobolus meristosporus CBS 931.73 TaxID=1314790 RepID=A0A1Y1YCF2_9FUNG|nr:ArfGap-domain-containing protein [Basidiobolus meristosporus CBS 931.73]|eukprot:ORX95294.1 ArfGap-domain-containing protein [Basidiobolus meristosporus CBS 931.73]